MSSVLVALETVIDRYGPSAVADPIVLAGALRAGTDPPTDAEIEVLVRAAGAGVVERMREVLDHGGDAAAGLAVAVAAVDPDADPTGPSPARWASTLVGAALGLVPRDWATDAGRPLTDATVERVTVDGSARRAAAPRGRWVLGGVATVLVLVGVLVGVAVVRSGPAGAEGSAAAPTVAVPLPSLPAPSGTAAQESVPATGPATGESPEPGLFDGAPANPRDAFTDPALLAMAGPYISRPGVTCAADPTPQISMNEHVSCDLGGGYLGFFQTMATPENVVEIREGYLDAEGPQPVATTVRSLRWRSVPGRPGVKTGIRATSADRGEGTRVRFLDHDGYKWLYFDVEGGRHYALLATPDPALDLDDLRAFWADPAG